MENILLLHYRMYPKMQIQDGVKLIYQNEFGPGHLVKDEADSLEQLLEELRILENHAARKSTKDGHPVPGKHYRPAQLRGLEKQRQYIKTQVSESPGIAQLKAMGKQYHDEKSQDLESSGSEKLSGVTGNKLHQFGAECALSDIFEDIGNGLIRLHLRNTKNIAISSTTLNKFFVYTANSVNGSIESFEEKLKTLIKCCKNGTLPFLPGEVEAWLLDYKERGYPPVRHSDIYNAAYSPSYRIVKREFRDFLQVFERIDSLLDSKDKIIVAIDGSSGSGKSSLAALLSNVYDCNVFHMDHYFLTPELRTKTRLEEAGGNVDYVRFKQEILAGLQSGGKFSFRAYDCKTQTLYKPVQVNPKKLNIIEGVYSMHPTLADSYDLKIFLHTDFDTQKLRILERNGQDMLQRFLDEWIPLENRYFNEMNIMGKCDLIIKT